MSYIRLVELDYEAQHASCFVLHKVLHTVRLYVLRDRSLQIYIADAHDILSAYIFYLYSTE